MTGDRAKPQSTFSRWIEHYWDGAYATTRKGATKVPSTGTDKQYERRWRRRQGRAETAEAQEYRQ